ncbi:methyltransferase [Thermopolyspora sp. NPDC052614]|uniref:methyltransferase n=1 Tax=Thermopolyspora sp. NPDC052614 TaxID=3155682 RepID=UPI0034171C19
MSEATIDHAGTAGDDPTFTVWELIRGLSRFAAVHTMVDLRCADHLKDGPLTVEELARRCEANASNLGRVLRMTAALGLIRQVAPNTYELTESGMTLCEDAPNSMRPAVLVNSEIGSWLATNAVPQTVRSGRGYMARHGTYYDYLAGIPEINHAFNEFMRSRTEPVAAAVASRYDFSGVGTLVDVGGGNGTMLAAILRANPGIRGTLLDRDNVVPDARANLSAQGLADRAELVIGDFFASVPAGADAYVMASIVHNWGDEDALRVLGVVREAMPDDGRVLLVDILLPDDDRPHVGREMDIRMLTVFDGGRERTRSEYLDLLKQAGLRGRVVADLPMGLSLIEALPTG